jgi:ArsR family transcriptional regulator
MSYASSTVKVGHLVELFRALGDETRMRMIAMLSHGELCVCHLEEGIGLTQPNASRHLGILRAAGIVATRRYNKWVYYRLAEPEDRLLAKHMKALAFHFALDQKVRAEVETLRKRLGPAA